MSEDQMRIPVVDEICTESCFGIWSRNILKQEKFSRSLFVFLFLGADRMEISRYALRGEVFMEF